jgi:hypothetical protein
MPEEPPESWIIETQDRRFVKHFGFSSPKMYALSHYVENIRQRGTPDNTSTDIPERMHKQLKTAFQRSNKLNFVPQILWYIDRTSSFNYKIAILKHLWMERGARIPGIITAPHLMQKHFKNSRASR